MALQLQSITDPGAVLDLIAILQSAPGGLTRDCVLTALGEKLKDPRAVPGLAAHLPNPAPSASYRTLDRTAVLYTMQQMVPSGTWRTIETGVE